MSSRQTADSGGSSTLSDGNQHLTFSLGTETYGVDILRVQEIRGYSSVTPIPNTPSWVRGVMNLRGTIVPVVDLRSKLGLPACEYSRFTVIIVVNVGAKIMGLIVDAVSDVLDFESKDFQEAPSLGSGTGSQFAKGIVHVKDELVVLLDLDQIFVAQEPAPELVAS
jgi:purine-binding chemotaxis protein CheW